ncbi:hypothetical protein [Allocoprobacillus halotolerans]|uniref:hypothetical protein n=1 Tax=Allocoprobacillus halotolerans TaxID=2944914 RepID=UPI00338DFF39
MTNTILVLGGIYLFFGHQYASALGMTFSKLLPYLLTLIATTSLLEAIVGTIIAVIVSRILIQIKK